MYFLKERNNMIEAITTRRSIRSYDPTQPVTKAQLDQLLEAAMLAPSACNSRPWEFIAITHRETLDEIAKIHPNAGMCATATAAIVVVAIPQTGIPEGYYPQDCGAATQNILLEAAAMGLGTCWCGVYPKADKVASLAGLLQIDPPKILFCVIAVGTADEDPVQRGFFDVKKVSYIR